MKLIASLILVIMATTQYVHAVEEEIDETDAAEMNRENNYYTKDKDAEKYQAKDADKIDEKIQKQETEEPAYKGDKYVAPPAVVKLKSSKKTPTPKKTPKPKKDDTPKPAADSPFDK